MTNPTATNLNLNQQSQPLEHLTRREREVASLVALALTDRQIAGIIFISPETVRYHIKSICSKLALPNRTAICRWVLVTHYEENTTVLGSVL
jgi:DNA-binding CsgD family transcriptional regulator